MAIRAGSLTSGAPAIMDETELAKVLIWAAGNHFPAELTKHGASALWRLDNLDPLRNFAESGIEVFHLDATEVMRQAVQMAVQRAEYARRHGRVVRPCTCPECREDRQREPREEGTS